MKFHEQFIGVKHEMIRKISLQVANAVKKRKVLAIGSRISLHATREGECSNKFPTSKGIMGKEEYIR